MKRSSRDSQRVSFSSMSGQCICVIVQDLSGMLIGIFPGQRRPSRTYKDENVVHDEQKPRDSRELEKNAPVGGIALTVFDLVVEQHAGCCDQVGYEAAPEVAQGILVEWPPWRMGSTEEDGLDNVSKLSHWQPISRVAAR